MIDAVFAYAARICLLELREGEDELSRGRFHNFSKVECEHVGSSISLRFGETDPAKYVEWIGDTIDDRWSMMPVFDGVRFGLRFSFADPDEAMMFRLIQPTL